MPKFSEQSIIKLNTVDPKLATIINEAIKIYDFTVLEGHRDAYSQNKAFEEGRSKLQYPESKHNKSPSLAIDIAPYPVDWNDLKRFYYLAGVVKALGLVHGINIRWGGDWDGDGDFKDQTFNDLVHFELS